MELARGTDPRQPLFIAAVFGFVVLTHSQLALSQPDSTLDAAGDSAARFVTAPETNPTEAIIVGPRAAVGTDTAGEKAAKGIAGGVLGSVFGSSDGAPRSDRPDTERDPTRKLDYAEFEAMNGRLETGARAQWIDGELLVSARIDDAPGNGTFQAVFLQDCAGRRFYPGRYEIYKLWPERGISVGWSRGTVRDGQVVEQDSGSFSGNWDDGVGHDELTSGPATWAQLGFDKAHHGARQIGAYFGISVEELAELDDALLFVHTTLPSQDPVTTEVSTWTVALGESDKVELAPAGQVDSWWGKCHASKEELTGRLEAQYEISTGAPVSVMPGEDREQIEVGSDDLWHDIALVGAQAKLLRRDR